MQKYLCSLYIKQFLEVNDCSLFWQCTIRTCIQLIKFGLHSNRLFVRASIVTVWLLELGLHILECLPQLVGSNLLDLQKSTFVNTRMAAAKGGVTYLEKYSAGDLQDRSCQSELQNNISRRTYRISWIFHSARPATYADESSSTRSSRYSGLNKTYIASFHPRTTRTPYIHIGICATLDTTLRLASI